jgi:hypothetical protein
MHARTRVDAGDEPHERLPPRLNRPQAHVVAVAAQKVERDERTARAPR